MMKHFDQILKFCPKFKLQTSILIFNPKIYKNFTSGLTIDR